jgi:hypothetical protein
MTIHMHGFEPDRQAQADVPNLSATGVPLACRRPMQAAILTVPTPLTLFGTLLMALLALPRGAMMAPALLRTRHHRRA